MKLNYINKIKANISIYSTKKTTNILEGTYKSVYKGKSMNFENLREYVINDDIKDIDWKSSARTGTLLVKQFISEKKHNIMLLMDTGAKMDADTDMHESKKEIALYTAGTIGYLAIKNSDYIGMIYSKENGIQYEPFRYNLYNLEQYLENYDKYSLSGGANINDICEYIYKNINKIIIIFIITDLAGLDIIESKKLKQLSQIHDVLIVNINDNYMFGHDIYDIHDSDYIPDMMLSDKKLNAIENEIRSELLKKNKNKLKKNNISMTSISSIKDINSQIIGLLEEHRYASSK